MDNVAIVGGGIGGLTAALALARRGIDVDVYEKGPELRELGAGVQISANGPGVPPALASRRHWKRCKCCRPARRSGCGTLGKAGSCSTSAWNRSNAMVFPTSPFIVAICMA